MFHGQIVMIFPAYDLTTEAACARKRHAPFTANEAQFAVHEISGKISVL